MDRPTRLLAIFAVLGAIAWLVKVGMISANGGTNTDEGPVGLAFLAGLVLLVLGSAALGLRVTVGRATWVRAGAALLSAVLFFATFALLEVLLVAIAGDAGPDWLEEELEIIGAALLWGAIGVWVLLSGGRHANSDAGGEPTGLSRSHDDADDDEPAQPSAP